MTGPLWADLLALANVLIYGMLAWLSWRHLRSLAGEPRWIRFMHLLIGLYWSCLYAFVVVTPTGNYNPVWFGQVFVRPAFTFTGAVMLAGSLHRWLVNRKKQS